MIDLLLKYDWLLYYLIGYVCGIISGYCAWGLV